MPDSYKQRIEEYCRTQGIEIPVGFYRHAGSRYEVIDMDSFPPKLLARRWSVKEDVAYYLNNLADGRRVRILDFKLRVELKHSGGVRLQPGDPF
jgi:hypothetical protein